jgi:capsular polysaccharide biosynthesis protein
LKQALKRLKALVRLATGRRPPVCRDLAEWVALRPDAELIGSIPEELLATRALPSNASSVPRFASECQVRTFDRSVVRLEGVRLHGGEGMLELPDGKFVLQTVWYPRQLVMHPDYYRRDKRTATPLAGTWHPLIAYWSRSYYHWLVETLPLLHGLEILLPNGTRHIVPGPMSRYHRESLELLGLEPGQYREVRPDEVLELESAFVATPATVTYAELPDSMLSPHWLDVLRERPFAGPFNHSPTGLRWVAEKMVAAAAVAATGPPPPRRIFITRRLASCRRLNDRDLAQVFSKHQIVVLAIEELSLVEQVRLFHHAELVVAPHGAGLSNLMFCNAGTRVLEIFEPSVVRLCYWSISDTFRLEYDFLMGRPLPSPGMDPDIHIAPTVLDEALTRLLLKPILRTIS